MARRDFICTQKRNKMFVHFMQFSPSRDDYDYYFIFHLSFFDACHTSSSAERVAVK
jgi:hypothetical protein